MLIFSFHFYKQFNVYLKKKRLLKRSSGKLVLSENDFLAFTDHNNPSKKPKPGGSLIDLDIIHEAFQDFVTEFKYVCSNTS